LVEIHKGAISCQRFSYRPEQIAKAHNRIYWRDNNYQFPDAAIGMYSALFLVLAGL
jgi:hypothetical protein